MPEPPALHCTERPSRWLVFFCSGLTSGLTIQCMRIVAGAVCIKLACVCCTRETWLQVPGASEPGNHGDEAACGPVYTHALCTGLVAQPCSQACNLLCCETLGAVLAGSSAITQGARFCEERRPSEHICAFFIL